METAYRIYIGCKTKEDSIRAAREARIKQTGSNDPNVWWEMYNSPGDYNTTIRLKILYYATSEYMVGTPFPYCPFIFKY